MCRTQAFVFFLLLGLNLPKAKGNCEFLEPEMHCVCSLQDQSQLKDFMNCLPATTYELQGGNLLQFQLFSETKATPEFIDILQALQVHKLIFTDLLIPEILLPGALEIVSYTSLVSKLEFVNCTFLRTAPWRNKGRLDLKVSSLRFHKVTAPPLDDLLDTSDLRGWLETLDNLTITESQVTYVPCKIGTVFTALGFLDISGNHFQDHSMKSSFCKGAFPQLKILKLHHNNLTSYEIVCDTVSHLSMLTHLDLSQNDFLPGNSSSRCMWPPSLRIFNLSNTGLEHMHRFLPPNVEILDLSANNMFTLDLSLPGLKELYLSKNRLQKVPSIDRLPSLEVLSLDQNQISQLPSKDMQRLKHLQSLKAGHNLYNCSCSNYISEIQELAAKTSLLPDWPQDYICKSPPHYEDYLVKDVPLPSLKCNKAQISHGSIVSLLTCVYLVLGLLPM
ncbi:monocyte differentiation antigen CD14 [Elgaria multicarinata webbii]|uniref:monocyte differentiation antigen CD14 n=1 Tax=Elgaria multicarinata webbii TaxID=159646 RepID=UPI002FCD0C85